MALTKEQKKSFLDKGKEVEKAFSKLFDDIEFSTNEEDMVDHVDLKVIFKIDVKGLKKVKRDPNLEPNEHFHWVELKNVKGKPGWLYGKAHFFAFELKEYWIVVAKEDLQKFIAEKCKDKIKTTSPALYKIYGRPPQKDKITLVTSYDLCYLSTRIIEKIKE